MMEATELLDEALAILGPKDDRDRERARMELSWIVRWYRRASGDDRPSPRRAREDIDELRKHLSRAATVLDRLDPFAVVHLFDRDRLDVERMDLADTLADVIAACDDATSDIPSPMGGRPKDFATCGLVRDCHRVFVKRREDTGDDFLRFCELVYEAASDNGGADVERFVMELKREHGK